MTIKIINAHSIFTENTVCLSNKTNWKIETDFQPQCGDLYLVFGAHEIAPSLLQARDPSGNRVRFVVLNSEQDQSQFLKNKYYIELMKRNVVVNFTSDDYLSKFGVKVLSYFDFEFIQFDLGDVERTYDITFIGSFSPERQKVVEKLKATYPDKTFYIDFEWKNTNIKDITEILSKSKYVLNIPYYENSSLETHRINKAIACGCEVVSLIPKTKNDVMDIYKKYIHFTDDLVQFFETTHIKRADYPNLMKELHTLHLSDLMWIVRQVKGGVSPPHDDE